MDAVTVVFLRSVVRLDGYPVSVVLLKSVTPPLTTERTGDEVFGVAVLAVGVTVEVSPLAVPSSRTVSILGLVSEEAVRDRDSSTSKFE